MRLVPPVGVLLVALCPRVLSTEQVRVWDGQTVSTSLPRDVAPAGRTLIIEHSFEPAIESRLKLAAGNSSISLNLGARSELVAELRAHAAGRQEATVALLRRRSSEHLRFKGFWICNCMAVWGATPALERELKELNGVTNVREQRYAYIPEGDGGDGVAADGLEKADLEWNIKITAADKVWQQADVTGQGVVVGTIDTGVRHTHEAMRDHYRGADHSWFDAEGTEPPRWPNGPSETPFDNNGHGTHVAGTLSGTHGIGVAPGADWITCKAFDSSGQGAEPHLLMCGEFMGCPTKWDGSDEDCTLGVNVLSNSWGFSCGGCTGEGDPLQRMTQTWRALGIYTTFAAGNSVRGRLRAYTHSLPFVYNVRILQGGVCGYRGKRWR